MAENKLYTTGELADACGLTVRTVQYYDKKGLLPPTDYSEGGRRLYDDQDVERLRFILLLKHLGLGLAQIKGVLESPNRNAILKILLDEHVERIQNEIDERSEQLRAINATRTDLELYGKVIATTEPAMVVRMKDEKARRKWYAMMIVMGVFMDAAWIGTLVLGILTGIWWPFPLSLVFVTIVGLWMVRHIQYHSTYICPICDAEFMPKFGAYFISNHTPRTRKLVCPCCGQKEWCVEHFHAEPLDLAPGECVPGTCTCKEEE